MASLSGSSQVIATTKEKQKASYRTLSDILHLGPRLADPKTCCGELYCTFANGDNCWEATNEVQRIYNVSMRYRIDEILKDTQEFWAQSAKCTHFFCHSIYMVGSEKEKSKPVVFFCCKNASLRIKARNAVKEHLDMSEYPYFRFGHAPVPPGPTTPLRLATGIEADSESDPDGGTSGLVFFMGRGQDLCGVQVIIKTDIVGRCLVEATVGGVISLEGKYFGLTVAHGLVDNLTSPEEMEEEGGWLFEYDSIDEDNISSIAQKDSTGEEKEVKSPTIQSSVIKTQEEPNTHTPLEARITKGKGVESNFWWLLGTIGPTSINDSSLGLDWALIEIDNYEKIDSINEVWFENPAAPDESHPQDLNASQDRQGKCIRISGIMQSIPPESSVLAIMGRCAPVPGTISGTIMSMKLPGATEMCEVWNVQLNGVIQSGDCGSFVIDSNTGDLYGFIVAGNIGTGFGYIMPAYKVQLDISRRLGRSFTLPNTEEYKQSRLLAARELLSTAHRAIPEEFEQEIHPKSGTPQRCFRPARFKNPDHTNSVNHPTVTRQIQQVDGGLISVVNSIEIGPFPVSEVEEFNQLDIEEPAFFAAQRDQRLTSFLSDRSPPYSSTQHVHRAHHDVASALRDFDRMFQDPSPPRRETR